MTDQASSLREILQARLEITQQISAATAEHLRLTQIASGMDVLELGGKDSDTVGRERDRTGLALQDCETHIAKLERKMAELDRRLGAIGAGEDT
ncbi:MAG: hypothetical protein ACK5IP_21045 [Paracoccus sp. (in: a-proteobacteria)]